MFSKFRETRDKIIESVREEKTATSGGKRVLIRKKTKDEIGNLGANDDTKHEVTEKSSGLDAHDGSSADWVRL